MVEFFQRTAGVGRKNDGCVIIDTHTHTHTHTHVYIRKYAKHISELRGQVTEIEAALVSRGVFMTVGAEATPANIARDALQLTHPGQVAFL